MKQLYIALNLFLLFSLITPKSVNAGFRDCSFFAEEVEVELSTSFGELEYNHTKDNRYIAEKTKLTKEKSDGYTHIENVFNCSLEHKIVKSFGLECWVPTKISLNIGYQNPKIYISKDIEENSCEYGLVKRNQQLYLQMYKASLEAYLPAIYAYLNDYAQSLETFKIKERNSLQQKSKMIRDAYKKEVKKIEKDLEKTNKKAIDLIKLVDSKKYEKSICKKPTE